MGVRVRSGVVDFVLAADMAVVSGVQAAGEAFAAADGLDADGAYFLGLALREALVNAIRHGRSATVRVRLRRHGGPRPRLVFLVADGGNGFEPAALPDPVSPEGLRRSSGRGVLFMERFADRLRFRFPARGGTVVRIEKLSERGPRGAEGES